MTHKTMKLSPFAELKIILKEILRALKDISAGDRLAYTVPQLADRAGVSDEQIYKHIERGDLTPVYSGTKKLIPVDEARRFIAELPTEDLGRL